LVGLHISVRGVRDDVMSAEEPRTDEEVKEFQLRLEGKHQSPRPRPRRGRKRRPSQDWRRSSADRPLRDFH
jgi:hypothetical protein